MKIADNQQLRLLDQLRHADGRPIPFAELRTGGVAFPAVVVAELELNGYRIERVRDHGQMIGVRLQNPGPAETPNQPPQPGRPRMRTTSPPRPDIRHAT
ncbi:MAG: hypothetical protein ACRET5_02055 [Steroidobacteraceae bacterium]